MGLFKKLVCSIFLFFMVLPFANANMYLCVSEDSTGFYFEKGSWINANFNVKDKKFIIRKLKSDDKYFKDKEYPYGVFELGENYSKMRCKDQSEFSKAIKCDVSYGQLYFSPETGRFIETYTSGYWDGVDNNDNTPNVIRGRCSKI